MYGYYRGFNILKAIIDDLLGKEMKNASEVILTGCSGWCVLVYS